MDFRKIHISEGGFRGAELHFFQEEEKGGRKQMVLTKKYSKNPVHLSLEKMFKDLRPHLLYICGLINDKMDESIKSQVIIETFVNTVELDSEVIILSGEKMVFDDKHIKIKTCKLQESDGYEHYETLKKLVLDICEETAEYLNGTKKVDDAELILRWAQAKHKEGEINEETIKGYSAEQLQEFAVRIIEKGLGGLVTLPEDLQINEDLLNSEVEQVVTEFEVSTKETAITLPVTTKKEKKAKKSETVVVTTSDNDDVF